MNSNRIISSNIIDDNSHLLLTAEDLSSISLSELPRDIEVIPFDSHQDGQYLLKGYHISLTRVALNRVVIGCKENSVYHSTGDEDFFPMSCLDFINEYLSRISFCKAA